MSNQNQLSRRTFIKQTSLGITGGGLLLGVSPLAQAIMPPPINNCISSASKHINLLLNSSTVTNFKGIDPFSSISNYNFLTTLDNYAASLLQNPQRLEQFKVTAQKIVSNMKQAGLLGDTNGILGAPKALSDLVASNYIQLNGFFTKKSLHPDVFEFREQALYENPPTAQYFADYNKLLAYNNSTNSNLNYLLSSASANLDKALREVPLSSKSTNSLKRGGFWGFLGAVVATVAAAVFLPGWAAALVFCAVAVAYYYW